MPAQKTGADIDCNHTVCYSMVALVFHATQRKLGQQVTREMVPIWVTAAFMAQAISRSIGSHSKFAFLKRNKVLNTFSGVFLTQNYNQSTKPKPHCQFDFNSHFTQHALSHHQKLYNYVSSQWIMVTHTKQFPNSDIDVWNFYIIHNVWH